MPSVRDWELLCVDGSTNIALLRNAIGQIRPFICPTLVAALSVAMHLVRIYKMEQVQDYSAEHCNQRKFYCLSFAITTSAR